MKECIIQNLVCLITKLLGPLGLYVSSFHRFSGGWLIFSAERFAQLYYWISSSNFSREKFFWSLPQYGNQIPLITRADCVYSTPQTLICGLLARQAHDGALGKQKAWTEPSSEGSQPLMKTYTSCMETKQEKKSKAPNSKTQELLQNVER